MSEKTILDYARERYQNSVKAKLAAEAEKTKKLLACRALKSDLEEHGLEYLLSDFVQLGWDLQKWDIDGRPVEHYLNRGEHAIQIYIKVLSGDQVDTVVFWNCNAVSGSCSALDMDEFKRRFGEFLAHFLINEDFEDVQEDSGDVVEPDGPRTRGDV